MPRFPDVFTSLPGFVYHREPIVDPDLLIEERENQIKDTEVRVEISEVVVAAIPESEQAHRRLDAERRTLVDLQTDPIKVPHRGVIFHGINLPARADRLSPPEVL